MAMIVDAHGQFIERVDQDAIEHGAIAHILVVVENNTGRGFETCVEITEEVATEGRQPQGIFRGEANELAFQAALALAGRSKIIKERGKVLIGSIDLVPQVTALATGEVIRNECGLAAPGRSGYPQQFVLFKKFITLLEKAGAA